MTAIAPTNEQYEGQAEGYDPNEPMEPIELDESTEIHLSETQRKKLMAKQERLLEHRRDYRRYYDQLWFANIAFMNGQQWGKWSQQTGYTPTNLHNMPPTKRLIVVNRILPKVMTIWAKLTQNPGVPAIDPETYDDEDKNGVYYGQAAIVSEWRRLKMRDKRRELALWVVATGNGYLKKAWNPDAGEMYEGKPTGDNEVSVLSPFRLTFMPGTRDIRKAWVAMESSQFDRDHAINLYPKYKKEIENAPTEESSYENYEQLLAHLYPGSEVVYAFTAYTERAMIEAHEIHILPNYDKDFPDGAMALFFGHEIAKVWKSPHTKLPYYHAQYRPRLGNTYAEGAIEPLIPLQEILNRFYTKIYQWAQKTGNAHILYEKSSGVDPNRFTDAGGYIPYRNFPPTYMNAPNPPAYFFKMIDLIEAEFDAVSGSQAVSEGRYPSSIKSGIAIGLIREQDDQDLAPKIMGIDRVMDDLANDLLQDAINKWETPRRISVVGRKMAHVAMNPTFSGKDISKKVNVTVSGGAGLTMSRTEQGQMMLDMFEMGMRDPSSPEDRREFEQIVGLGSAMNYIDPLAQDESRARTENIDFQSENFAEPRFELFHNHSIHIRVHDSLRNSDWYTKEASDEQRQNVDQHVALHKKGRLVKKAEPVMEDVEIQASAELLHASMINTAPPEEQATEQSDAAQADGGQGQGSPPPQDTVQGDQGSPDSQAAAPEAAPSEGQAQGGEFYG